MDSTLHSFNKSENEITKEIVKDSDKALRTFKDHLEFAASHTQDLDFASALEWTETYLAKQGITQPSKLTSFLSNARSNDDVKEPFQGQELALRSQLGAWGNLLAGDAFNLLIAAPKVGKSALIVHVFACSKRGDETCLGAPIRKRWNKLIISGNDMSVGEWGKILIREGLAVPTGDDHEKFLPDPCVIIWDTENPARMNEKGIKAMAAKCLEHPDSLLVIDSLRSNTDPSLDENKAEIREPIEQTKKGLAGCKVTTVLIHHANKSVSGSTAMTAAAGNNAIPGACDNTLLLKHLKPEPIAGFRSDGRLTASSSGRLQGDRLLIELTSEGIGRWEARGDAETASLEEHIAEVEERLNPRHTAVYEHAEELAENGVHTTTAEIGSHLNLTVIKARKALEALCRKGLMRRCGTLSNGGKGRDQVLYAPALSSLPHAGDAVGGVNGVHGVLNQEDGLLKTPKTFKTPSNLILTREAIKTPVDSPLNTPLEILRPSGWEGGYLLANGSDPDKVIAVKTGSLDHRVHNLRWGIDVRPCESPFRLPEPQVDW